MSRIGRRPIDVPAGVEVVVETGRVAVSGPRGSLQESFSHDITVEKQDGSIVVTRPTDRPEHRALHGLVRTLVANMVTGVTGASRSASRSRGSATVPTSGAATSSSPSATPTPSR